MYIFIDTSIYLTFFHYTSDDLEELKKLEAYLKQGKIVLILTDQVENEFRRNRETKIADALQTFESQKFPGTYPHFCKEYEEYPSLRQAASQYSKAKIALLEKLKIDIKAKNLGADKIISSLFSLASRVESTQDLVARSKIRYDRGTPPGKKKSYGDAINWENLLETIPVSEDLHFIAKDSDYDSEIDDNDFSEYLTDEWKELKKSEISYYKTLSDFFGQHFPDIQLASEIEKEPYIANLAESGSFASTHLAIARLSKFNSFTDREVNLILLAGTNNGQVYGISEDEDVRIFFNTLVSGRQTKISSELLEDYTNKFCSTEVLVEAPF